MKTTKKEVEFRLDQFKSTARKAGVKLTHQRLEIFREISSNINHPSAETIFSLIKQRMPTISLDTVYRTLWLLSDLDLISTLGARRESVRFDANMEHHHHFVCKQCGLVRDFKSEELKDLQIPNAVKKLGNIESTHVEVRGICTVCSKDRADHSTLKNPQPQKGKKRR